MPLLGLTQQRGRPERLQLAPLGEQVPVGSYPGRPEKALPPSSTGVRTAGHSANQAILEDNIETFKGQGLAQAGLLADHIAEASVAYQAGLLAHLLWAGEVLSAALVVAALEVLTEEAMEEVMEEAAMAVAVEVAEATVKLKEKVSEEGPM